MLLHAAPCIGHLHKDLAPASPKHITALLSGRSRISRLTCSGKAANGSKLKQLLWHCTQSPALDKLAVRCPIEGPMVMRTALLKMASDEEVKLPAGRQPRPRKLCVPSGVTSLHFARALVTLINANKAILRTLELEEVLQCYEQVVDSVLASRGLLGVSITSGESSPPPPSGSWRD